MPHNFWMVVCNQTNFGITRDMGFKLLGLKGQHRRKVQRIGSGDRILFYVTHLRRFTATATAMASYVEDVTPIWEKEGVADWPYRVQTKPEIILTDSQFIDANLLAPRLDYVRRWAPENWYMAFQGNLHLLPKSDFLLIEEEMKKLSLGEKYNRDAAPPITEPARRKKGGSRRGRNRDSARTSPQAASPQTENAVDNGGAQAPQRRPAVQARGRATS